MNAQQFVSALVNEVLKFDQMIMESIRPVDGWIGNVSYGPFKPDWFEVRESVRKLSEGRAYKPTRFRNPGIQGSPCEITQDRFSAIWPNVRL